MTEEEAKKKWCPFARAALYHGDSKGATRTLAGGHNRAAFTGDHHSWPESLNPEFCRCIASDCMAWGWHAEREKLGGYCGLIEDPYG